MKWSLAAVFVALDLLAGAALAQDRAQLETALMASKAAIAEQNVVEEQAKGRAELDCNESTAAENRLLSASPGNTKAFIDADDKARKALAKCQASKAALALVQDTQKLARTQWRESAARLAACLDQPAIHCPKALPTQKPVAKKDEAEKNPLVLLLAAAGKAQGDMDTLRKKAGPAYDNGDGATKSALGIVYRDLPSDKELERPKLAEELAESARVTPRQVREAVGIAQSAADIFVAAALALRPCVGKESHDNTCEPEQETKAKEAQALLKLHSDRATALLDRLDQARYSLAALAVEPESTRDDLSAAVVFRKLLDSNPDVKSYFGSDAVGLSAGTSGNSVSLRYTMENAQVLGRTRATVVVTSPTGGVNGGTLYDTADRFKDKASISLGFQTTRVGNKLKTLNVVQDWAVGATLAREDRSYLLPGSATVPRLVEQSKSYYNLGVSGTYVWLLNPGEDTRMAKLRYAVQQVRKDAAKTRQCDASQSSYTDPKDPTKIYNLTNLSNCVEGPLGAPGRDINRVLEFGFKQLGLIGDADVGLTATHNLKSSQTDVELPIYFWKYKNTTPGADGLTGGLVVNWTSVKPGLRWGLFVSTPLSFSRPAER